MDNLISDILKKIKISKRIIKEEGFFNFIKFILNKINNKYLSRFKNKYLFKKFLYFSKKLETIDKIIIIISGMKYSKTIGNRSTYLASEFNKKNYLILYIYFTWDKSEEDKIGFIDNENIFLMPLRIFYENSVHIFDLINKYKLNKKLLLIETPFKEIFEILSYANSFKFFTIYDIIDDWEEFHNVNQAPWYDKQIEEYVLNNSDLKVAVSKGLNEKFSKYKPYVISNGFAPYEFEEYKISKIYKKGEINIGYFGHLTSAWFDWDLILKIAKKEKNWYFHLIGYGIPIDLKLPENIIYYGKIEHKNLKSYFYDCDVAIIPFKKNKLSENSDPIKLYEYLYLGKPVVVQGVENIKDYPYVFVAKNIDEFIEYIRYAKYLFIDRKVIDDFLINFTWDKKVNDLEELINIYYKLKDTYLILNWAIT